MAEGLGFEPRQGVSPSRLAGERHKPLGHPSIKHANLAGLLNWWSDRELNPDLRCAKPMFSQLNYHPGGRRPKPLAETWCREQESNLHSPKALGLQPSEFAITQPLQRRWAALWMGNPTHATTPNF